MELCITHTIPSLPNTSKSLSFLVTNPCNLIRFSAFLPLNRAPNYRGLHSRISHFANSLPRATASEETSYGANRYTVEESDKAIAVEDVPSVEKNGYADTILEDSPKEESLPADDQEQTSEFLDNLNKLDPEEAYSIILYGSAALAAIWLASALVGAIDSIPVFPKLMEVVGLGYTFWFSTRYLLFKENRDELAAKIEELKQQVLGSND